MELQSHNSEELFDFGFEFDVNATFQDITSEVLGDESTELDEKIARIETILQTANSDEYRDFVDFQQMAMQIQSFCDHNHVATNQISNNETIRGFMDTHAGDHVHDHDHPSSPHEHSEKKDKKKDKKKKKKSWWETYAKSPKQTPPKKSIFGFSL